MAKTPYFLNITSILVLLILITACDDFYEADSDETEILEKIEEVSKISGAEDVTIVINKDQKAYFSLEFSGINSNNVIENGLRGGWCIDWKKPIDSNSGVYSGITLYSTYLVEKWKPLNYLLNIKEELIEKDADLTYKEIQIVIWSLRAFPEFKLDEVALGDLPNRMVDNGSPSFNRQKVDEILAKVETGYKEFNFSEGTKFAVVVATPAEVQTLITVSE